ncbi:hypothetical protein GWI33_018682 [Rhynchophorus ferrugineus]|uniref:Protein kinase domain-containing protein n=1 Tax=Rhynchophorus ferrugineus TaxID=354439 RepID=A0A834HUJ1_RHYFE|nr:hypothetical protein GWI33_018682 [Rhynchophorus ferrugineus]
MDVFNKYLSHVSSSVSQTVSQLSGVLPGNPVTREYDCLTHVASAGPGSVWKIYRGVKRSTKQEASIFVFEKRNLDRWNKGDKELILETLRYGVQQLTKIRHPQVLTVQHSLEESRESIAFATEPVFASLANVLGETTNMPQPIAEGVAFLHNDVKLLHKNICPESIVINASGVWKIFGLDFCIHNTKPPNQVADYPFHEYSPLIPNVCHPNISYTAPECILDHLHSPASDMFSLGMLMYALYSNNKQSLIPVKDIQQYKQVVGQLKNLAICKLQSIPEQLRENVKLLLNVTPGVRPDANQFSKIPYFDDVGIKTLTYLDSLLQWDNLQKSQFYKGLPEALTKLPHRVKLQRVLACLIRDLNHPSMVPFILPSIFDISQDCTKEEYKAHILPHLKPLMKLMEPIQILLIMLQRMELLLKLTPADDIQLHVLPMLYRGLDADSPQIHELCLSVLPTFAGLLDHANVKNSLLPRIKRLCLTTSTLSVRVNCLLCVGKLLENLDKWLVLDEVLPFLPQIPSREPAVLMGILGIYKIALRHKKLGISKEIIATRVLPFLIPLCIENGLTLAQFGAVTALVKEMFQLVETEHRTKLEQLNSIKDEEKSLAAAMPNVTHAIQPVELSTAFAGLGLDSVVESKIPSQANTINIARKQPVQALQNRSIIEPQKISGQSKPQPKDLTMSLLDDFIGSQSTAKHCPPTPPVIKNFSQVNATVPSQATFPNYSSLVSTQPNNLYQHFNSPSWNSPSLQVFNKQQPSSDWSTFETLSYSNVSVNTMLSTSQNTLSPNNNSHPILSKSDLLDFLN